MILRLLFKYFGLFIFCLGLSMVTGGVNGIYCMIFIGLTLFIEFGREDSIIVEWEDEDDRDSRSQNKEKSEM